MNHTNKKSGAPAVAKNLLLEITEQPGVTSRDRLLTNIAAHGLASNARTVMDFSKASFGELSLTDMVASLAEEGGRINKGDMSGAEKLLTAQALALNAIFTELTRRAALNMGEYMDATETYLRLGMKAQSQCRATLETLAVIKNPPVFAKQANIAHGPQQVNNGSFESSTHTPAHAGENVNPQTKLLVDDRNGSTLMDNRTATAATRGHSAVEAVAPVNGADKPRRKGQG